MPTSGPGSSRDARPGPIRTGRQRGFTLIELLVVVAVVAIATAGVSLALRDSGSTRLEREGQRLAALLEAARAQSRATGVPVAWRAQPGGFRFDGLPAGTLPDRWLDAGTSASGPVRVLLGPEPVIGPQALQLGSSALPGRSLWVVTDGVRPFSVQAQP